MRPVFEAAGGIDGMRRLAADWHRRVIADELVATLPATVSIRSMSIVSPRIEPRYGGYSEKGRSGFLLLSPRHGIFIGRRSGWAPVGGLLLRNPLRTSKLFEVHSLAPITLEWAGHFGRPDLHACSVGSLSKR
jgi:hypothetical protein